MMQKIRELQTLPSFHSLVAGLITPKSSSLVTDFGSRSMATGFFPRNLFVCFNAFQTQLFPVPALPRINTECRTSNSSWSWTTCVNDIYISHMRIISECIQQLTVIRFTYSFHSSLRWKQMGLSVHFFGCSDTSELVLRKLFFFLIFNLIWWGSTDWL